MQESNKLKSILKEKSKQLHIRTQHRNNYARSLKDDKEKIQDEGSLGALRRQEEICI